jgi:hypothetical protein
MTLRVSGQGAAHRETDQGGFPYFVLLEFNSFW